MEQATVKLDRWQEPQEKPRYPEIKEYPFTKRDFLVLQTLVRYPLLRSSWLWKLAGGDSRSEKRFVERLNFLRHKGVLERPDGQRRTNYNKNRQRIVYRLSENGFRLLQDRGLADKKQRASIKQFAHTLASCDVIADIEIALMGHKTLRFVTSDEIMKRAPADIQNSKNPWAFPVTIAHPVAGRLITQDAHYVADGWFGIEFEPQGRDRPRRRYFAVEVNHGVNVRANNLTDALHLRKFLSLNELRKQKIFQERLGTNAPVVALFVQAEENVTLNAMNLLKELSGVKGSERFAFKTMPPFYEWPVSPEPDGKTLTTPWRRVSHEGLRIDQE